MKPLTEIPIEELFMCNNFDLLPYGINAWCYCHNPYRLVIQMKTNPQEPTKAIQIDIPTYKIEHPEKLIATKQTLFTVLEYTKQNAHTTLEIDWERFKTRFINACNKLQA
jgi:hypothetical protein